MPRTIFWARAIWTFIGEAVRSVRSENDGEYWEIFSFEFPPVAQ